MFRTIRVKITALYILIFGITLAAFSIVLYMLYAQKSRSDFDLVLANDALTIANTVKRDGLFQAEMLSNLTDGAFFVNFGRDEYIEIRSFDGRIIAKSRNLQQNLLPVPRELFQLALSGQEVYQTTRPDLAEGTFWGESDLRSLAFPINDIGFSKYVIVVAAPISSVEHSLLGLRLMFLIAIPLTLLVASVGGWLLAKKAFDPIDKIIHTARSITAERLNKRLEVNSVDDEITRLSKTLNEMIDRLDKSFQSQRQFTADASHELRTPLTILKGEMEVALQQKRETSEYEETLRSAIQEIRRINKTVDDLLLLARLDAGQLSLQLRVVRLDELLMDAVAKVTASCQKKNISIVLDIIGVTEGEDAKELNILGDRDKLMNVFLNLLDNAMKYSGEGKNIRVTVGLATDSAEVRVTDDGIGIHPQDLPHIFDRFYRVDKARSYQDSVETSGSGLGLSIAKWIVEAHKGTISVESLIGKGTTITVRIPLASAIPT